MKELKKINVKLYERHYLTITKFDYLWENTIPDLDIKKNYGDYLYIKILKGTDYCYAFTILEDQVYYHGIVNLFIIDILTSEYLQNVEYCDKLKNINETFGGTLQEAFTNKKYIF